MDEVTEMHAKILEYRKAYNIDERQKKFYQFNIML